MMMLVWFFATFGLVLLISFVLGIDPIPSHARSAGAYGAPTIFFIVLPAFVAWTMTLAEVEGRRVHVLLRVWIRQGRATHYVGGWLPAPRESGPFRYREIKVRQRG